MKLCQWSKMFLLVRLGSWQKATNNSLSVGNICWLSTTVSALSQIQAKETKQP